MAKSLADAVFDAALSYLATNGTRLDICSAQPTTYTEATSTYSLGNVTLDGADYGSPANGDTSGRKIAVAQQSVTPGSSGTVTHVAISNTSGTALLAVTTCASQAVSSGVAVTVTAFDVEILDPT